MFSHILEYVSLFRVLKPNIANLVEQYFAYEQSEDLYNFVKNACKDCNIFIGVVKSFVCTYTYFLPQLVLILRMLATVILRVVSSFFTPLFPLSHVRNWIKSRNTLNGPRIVKQCV